MHGDFIFIQVCMFSLRVSRDYLISHGLKINADNFYCKIPNNHPCNHSKSTSYSQALPLHHLFTTLLLIHVFTQYQEAAPCLRKISFSHFRRPGHGTSATLCLVTHVLVWNLLLSTESCHQPSWIANSPWMFDVHCIHYTLSHLIYKEECLHIVISRGYTFSVGYTSYVREQRCSNEVKFHLLMNFGPSTSRRAYFPFHVFC